MNIGFLGSLDFLLGRLGIWGTNANQPIEKFSTYTDQTDADASWVTDDTTNLRVNVTNDNLVVKSPSGVIFNGVGYNLTTTLSDTQWVARFKLDITNITEGVNAQGQSLFYGFSDDIVSDSDQAQDFLGFFVFVKPTSEIRIISSNGSAPNSPTSSLTFTHVPVTEILYIEFTRLSATSFKIELFSDASFTTSIESQTLTINSGIIGLDNFKVMNNVGSASADHIHEATVDDIEVKDGVTVWSS